MKKSRFNLSETLLGTGEMGKLLPVYSREMLPNDTFICEVNGIHKMQPLIAPLMHQIDVMTQWYFVPTRLLWEGWTEFITGGDDGTAEPEHPYMKTSETGAEINTLEDYLGIPTGEKNLKYSALPIRAYNKIWNDHYKTDDIQEEVEISYADGLDTTTPKELFNCNWARDRFTKAKPFTQRGNQITVPVTSTTTNEILEYVIYSPTVTFLELLDTEPQDLNKLGEITADKPIYQGTYNAEGGATYITYKINPTITTTITEAYIALYPGPNYTATQKNRGAGDGAQQYKYAKVKIDWGEPQSYSNSQLIDLKLNDATYVYSNEQMSYNESRWRIRYISGFSTITGKISIPRTLTSATGINVRDLRIASAMQRFQERSLKYGAEYEDYCKMEFGVKPRDSRIQKSEYLGGSKSIVQISGIYQTTDTTDTPLGAEAGTGIAGHKQRRIRYRAPEHGIIMCLLSYRPKTLYTQGIKRELLRKSRFDYYTREFQDIGAEEILAQEIYATESNEGAVFGYDLAGNYRDYKTAYNRVQGNFKTDLNFWHLGRFFQSQPLLNASFLTMKPRKDILAITDQALPAFMFIMNFGIIAFRPMPRKSRNLLK